MNLDKGKNIQDHTDQWKRIGFATNGKASKIGRRGFDVKWRIVDSSKRLETYFLFVLKLLTDRKIGYMP